MREAGREVSPLSRCYECGRPYDMTSAEETALDRLGDDGFRFWALRGWWAAVPQGDSA